MTTNTLSKFKKRYSEHQVEEMSLQEYLDLCKVDKMAYASAAERMLKAIGEPVFVDTKTNPRLSRIFSNRVIKTYPAFKNFYGIEESIEKLVAFFHHAAQGLEERRQILYALGPVGSSKSSLAEKLKDLMEAYPIYALKAGNQVSPMYESPLGLFNPKEDGEDLEQNYGISPRYLSGVTSPWAMKRLREFEGNIEKFTVIKVWPSRLNQIAITKVEPADENTNDVSTLVGKVDIRKLEDFSQDDPDAYSYSGGLNVATQGILEFVEMFKAPIKMLHPLLTATQEGNYNGTQGFGALPFQGIILAHSNESEWEQFKNNKTNEAFLDRVCVVKVPYCLRLDEEVNIYKKLLGNSTLKDAPVVPGTLEMMAQFSILSRLKKPENATLYSKMKIYNGEDLKETDPKAKSLQEYKDFAGVDEGMDGLSTRFAYKILSQVFNYDPTEIGANPVHLMYVLEKQIQQEQYPADVEESYISFIKGVLAPKYAEFIGDELQKAFIESYQELGQNLFEKYILFADAWIQNNDFRDPDTGEMYDREILNQELEKLEKVAQISNPKDYRSEVVNFCLRYRASNGGKNPAWNAYEKMRNAIEKKLFTNTEELLPVISFGSKKSKDEEKKHNNFIERMTSRGYSLKQIRLLCDYYMRVRKSS